MGLPVLVTERVEHARTYPQCVGPCRASPGFRSTKPASAKPARPLPSIHPEPPRHAGPSRGATRAHMCACIRVCVCVCACMRVCVCVCVCVCVRARGNTEVSARWAHTRVRRRTFRSLQRGAVWACTWPQQHPSVRQSLRPHHYCNPSLPPSLPCMAWHPCLGKFRRSRCSQPGHGRWIAVHGTCQRTRRGMARGAVLLKLGQPGVVEAGPQRQRVLVEQRVQLRVAPCDHHRDATICHR